MRLFYFLLVMTVLFGACKPEPAAESAPEPAAPAIQQTQQPRPAPQRMDNPLMDTREAQFLLTNFWVFEYYIIPNNHPASVENRGRWVAFSEDGTFECGHWENQTSQGTWTIFNDDGKLKVRLDAVDNVEDAEWELQFNADGDVASWIGTSTFPTNKGVMAKVINLMTRPTKKQFGYE
ncbi:MAG: hypothetical protein AAF705_19335 [Bacteroidota bacterium]